MIHFLISIAAGFSLAATANTAAAEDLDAIYESVRKHRSDFLSPFPLVHPVLEEIPERRRRDLKEKGKTADFLFDNVMQRNADCQSACDYNTAAALVTLPRRRRRAVSPENLYQKLLEKTKQRGRHCLRKVLDFALEYLEAHQAPKACTKEENKNHPACKTMLKDTEDLQNRIADLAEAAYGTKRDSAMEAAAPCFSCSLEGNEKTINPFLLNYKNWEEAESCYSLNPGEEKALSSGEPLTRSYLLKREENGDYSISFPLEFAITNDYNGPVPVVDVPTEYRNKAQNCLKEAGEYLIGPQGEKIKLSVTKSLPPEPQESRDYGEKECRPDDFSPKKNVRVIKIGSEFTRSKTKTWEWDISCSTIVHEILHLTGLCDEYRETSKGFWTNPETGEIIGANFGSDKMRKKPEGSVFQAAYDCRVTAELSIMGSSAKIWKAVKNGDSPSLLTPGQFQKLLFGECSGKNKRFNKCSILAYQSSQEEGEECLKAKERCEKENGLGLDKQTELNDVQREIQKLEKRRQEQKDRIKSLQDKGIYDKTHREVLPEELKHVWELLKAEKERAGKAARTGNVFEESESARLIKKYDAEYWRLFRLRDRLRGKGLLDQTQREYMEARLNKTESRLQALRERARTVEAWPDPE